jgi:hypothetical protein
MSRNPKPIRESDQAFMHKCADRMNIPWRVIISNPIYIDMLRDARYSGMSAGEAISYFNEVLHETAARSYVPPTYEQVR